MLAGVKLKSFQLEWDNGPVCVFDCKFSPDGLRCAAVDSYGFLTIMGFGSDELYKKVGQLMILYQSYIVGCLVKGYQCPSGYHILQNCFLAVDAI